ncbi:hypothetical protein CTI12_AA412420 [Artemisia annua]|uniref:Uncharacterized protein n=1 Tax=Artemisia annua TaxID=35608 RepID=A0A2U1M9A1_ARTAN|nr:hypothetical protein CTI12_AA412420 [Artemisia annua]
MPNLELVKALLDHNAPAVYFHPDEVQLPKISNFYGVFPRAYWHGIFPNCMIYIQGTTKLGIGVKHDVDKSDRFLDSSKKYQTVDADYLG